MNFFHNSDRNQQVSPYYRRNDNGCFLKSNRNHEKSKKTRIPESTNVGLGRFWPDVSWAAGSSGGGNVRLAYPGGYYPGGYYQQQQALTLIDQLRIRAAQYQQAYYRQYAIIMYTRADQIRVQQRHLAAMRQMRWNYQQYRKIMDHIKKLQQQNGSGNYQTVKR